MLTDKRKDKFQQVISRRQFDLTVVLENVHDPHNIGAVMRTCDAIGISEMYILYTEKELKNRAEYVGFNSSSGSRKWVKVHFMYNVHECFTLIKKKYKNVFATHMSEDSVSLYDLNLSQPTALVFGNEHNGISNEALSYVDGNFLIPQYGMVQSLNISVACAVSLYEASRQRKVKGKYDNPFDLDNTDHKILWDRYNANHKPREEKS